MVKKKIVISIILIICVVIGGVYFKMKNDTREKEKELYYKEQQERITLYLKYNTKEPNTIKNVDFTKAEVGPMGDVVFDGYINGNKKDDFSAFSSPEDNFQFEGDLTLSEGLAQLLKPAHQLKSFEEIEKEVKQEKEKH
ncbi:DUF1433 domain-containing protein [Macrococcus armenti]|uniref:DUF1433 domain-containing protein n=1 Tax=Macrococcus armenti TaxID=2875764 RepID=UPI001CCD525E|nr:DUF1433 domain-containing protein [Macrococcus armenti]UBH08274.1 DUF1433 domain-containing protein [Macrococcus armenti]UBH10505.1 DUF1433 domain-containing protein [Macrococcus armenti]